jgi:Flp pilus assembly protein TadD
MAQRLFLVPVLLFLGATPVLASPASSLLSQAQAAQRHGKTELALRLAQSAIVANPADPATYIGLGDIYAHAGDAEFARNSYEKALDIDPQQPIALKAIAALDKDAKPDTASATP